MIERKELLEDKISKIFSFVFALGLLSLYVYFLFTTTWLLYFVAICNIASIFFFIILFIKFTYYDKD